MTQIGPRYGVSMAALAVPTPRVLIIGAGFAGLSAARALEGSGADVTIVDRHIYSTFQPLLYQVATGGLNPGDVAYPIRSFGRRRAHTRFRHGTVTAIHPRAVTLADGSHLDFDYLVVAAGATVNYFGVPGAADHAQTLYTRAEAIALRDTLMGCLEEQAARDDGGLSIVVIGGGATGVEMAGTLAELRNAGLAVAFPEVDPGKVQVVLVEQGPELLAPFHPKLRAYTLRQLERRGVDVRLRTAIREVGPDKVVIASQDGAATKELRADITVWAAGVTVSPAIGQWGLPQGRGGRVLVGPDLRVDSADRIFAAGDVAIGEEHPLPQLAQPAIQTGAHAGRQIARLIAGHRAETFTYSDKGTMATIGRRAAIVQLPPAPGFTTGVRLTGTTAWLAWLGLHIVTLLGNRNRASALLNLSWRYLAWPSGSGVIVGDIPEHPPGPKR